MFTCTHRPNSAAPELRACLGRMAFRRRARNEQNHDASCLTISPLTMPTPPTQCRIAPRGRAMGTPGQSRIERRLTAILAADIAGYSRLMGIDEVGTARALREHRAAVDPIMASHGGRIVKTTGDGILVEFPSIVAAVECAIAVQKLMAERNADLLEDRQMRFRIGINLGDVPIEGDDILGDGVNVAARLEGIAEPGGIYISDDAFRQVRGKIDPIGNAA